jgi:hypothetical protein
MDDQETGSGAEYNGVEFEGDDGQVVPHAPECSAIDTRRMKNVEVGLPVLGKLLFKIGILKVKYATRSSVNVIQNPESDDLLDLRVHGAHSSCLPEASRTPTIMATRAMMISSPVYVICCLRSVDLTNAGCFVEMPATVQTSAAVICPASHRI